jgi:hypothetical protein
MLDMRAWGADIDRRLAERQRILYTQADQLHARLGREGYTARLVNEVGAPAIVITHPRNHRHAMTFRAGMVGGTVFWRWTSHLPRLFEGDDEVVAFVKNWLPSS